MYVYLAAGLCKSPLSPDDDEFLQVEAIPLKEAMAMSRTDKLPDSKSLAALWLAEARLLPDDSSKI